MKNYLFYIIALLFCVNSQAQLTPEEETVTTKILFETTNYTVDDYGRDNIFTPITSYRGCVYFIYIDSLRHPILGKVDQEGVVSTSRLDKNDEDPYYVQKDGHNKYSIGIDKKGYLHVVGDMHHYGHETMYAYVDRYAGYNYNVNPDGVNTIMYWVSEAPEDITSFEFVGGDKDRKIPGNGFSYTSFHSDMNGELYVRNRSRIAEVGHYDGEMGWTASKYNVSTKRWTEIGGYAPTDLLPKYPSNYEALYKAVFWEDNGLDTDSPDKNWYQGFTGYMRFDYNNRCHFATSINNDNDNNTGMTDIVYAYSDDGGLTFNRADGSLISELPIRAESGAGQGSIVTKSLDPEIGFKITTTICTDKDGLPMVTYNKAGNIEVDPTMLPYKYWNQEKNSWVEEIHPTGGGGELILLDANGIVSYISSSPNGLITRKFGLEPIETRVFEHYSTWLDAYFYGADQRGIREQNVTRGFFFDRDEEVKTLRIVEVEGIPNLTEISEEWTTSTIGSAIGENGMFHDIFQLKSEGVFNENISGQYVNQTIDGDFELEARIINVNYVTDSSFAGLMVKNENEESAFFSVVSTSYQGVQTISKNGSEEFKINTGNTYEPSEWLKIKREGDSLVSYRSDNGENWMVLDSTEIELEETVSYGLISGSGNTVDLGHARVDHLTLTKINVLSIEEVNGKSLALDVFPNPTNGDQINVIFSSVVNSDVSLKVINALGVVQNVNIQKNNKETYKVDIDGLSSGLYYIVGNDGVNNATQSFLVD